MKVNDLFWAQDEKIWYKTVIYRYFQFESLGRHGRWTIHQNGYTFMGSYSNINQCCNEDWKWTEDEDEESSGLQKRPKTKTKILQNFEKSSKTFEDSNFFEDIRRIEDFCQHIKKNMQSEKYVLWKIVWWYWPL